jgi:hypothetical protein
VEALIEITSLLAEDSEPQPDIALIIAPEAGGARFSDNGYLIDRPHLVVEIANSSAAIDLLTDAVFDRRATRLLATLKRGLASPEHAAFAAKLAAKLAAKNA